jgi:adenylate cyclase
MNKTPGLEGIRACLEGVVPSVIATVAADGTPNITLVSQVHYVDPNHVALSFQFFNKTRENILANPYAVVQVLDPDTSAHYRLELKYLRTEERGPLFENMKAKLAGIASHTGMAKVFQLRGADIYQVLSIDGTAAERLPCALPQGGRLAALKAVLRHLNQFQELEELLEATLAALQEYFDIRHGMILMYDEHGKRLFTVASRGYTVSGIGAEIPLGTGVIGVSAQQQTPIRIMYMTSQYAYNLAVRENLMQHNPALTLETEIPFAGLEDPHSQLAVPLVLQDALLGVLYVDSEQDLRFSYEDEDALMSLAAYLAMRIHLLLQTADNSDASADTGSILAQPGGRPLTIRHYQANDSVFIDDEYLIKGVAGAIFWKLLRDYSEHGRTEFNNRELRLDPQLGLPEVGDNLEARLILLQKRLQERSTFLRLEKTGRGRFSLHINRALKLQSA